VARSGPRPLLPFSSHCCCALTARLYRIDFSRTVTQNVLLMQKTPEQWLEVTAPEKKSGVFKLFLDMRRA